MTEQTITWQGETGRVVATHGANAYDVVNGDGDTVRWNVPAHVTPRHRCTVRPADSYSLVTVWTRRAGKRSAR